MKLWRTPFDHNPVAEPLGYVHIDKNRCKGCGFCVEFCPRSVLQMGTELNSKGYRMPEVVKENQCLACGYCELICPEFAITLALNDSGQLGVESQSNGCNPAGPAH
jgi:2-oxoglutarate ferredoxin oxidoreductase subunit delta